MQFSLHERVELLSGKGVGPKVVERREQAGLFTLTQLADADADADANDILAQGVSLTGSSCWENSPQAEAAIYAEIGAAVAAVDRRTLLK